MNKWLVVWALIVSASASAAVTPIPDALEVQAVAARKDAQAMQEYLQRFQQAYEADPAAERPLIQAYWALHGETDTSLEAFFDNWVSQHPQSYEAHLVRGIYFWGRATLIAKPKSISNVVQSEKAWKQYENFMTRARQDLEAAVELSPHPIAAQRTLIAICSDQRDTGCIKDTYRQGLVGAPKSLALRRGYLGWMNDPKEWERELAEAEKLGVNEEAIKVLKAERKLQESWKIRQADGGTEVSIYKNIVKSVQDPWLDERAAHMFFRRANYAEAIPLYTSALETHPNLEDVLYWRGQAYYAIGNFQAGHADTMRAALIGNPQASRALIDFYISGEKGLPKDFAMAARWCSIAARRDQSYGAFCLGDLYSNGYDVYPRDKKKSMFWTRRAAELGHQTAQHDLGITLLNGIGGQPPNREEGIYWLKLSAQGGFEYADRKLRMHLSSWEYFKEITWPAYRDGFLNGGISFSSVIGLLMEIVRALLN